MPHTPGPWRAVSCEDDPYGDITISTDAQRDIAKLWLDDAPVADYNYEQCANARLIAAAPDLLAVLKSVMDFWEATGFAECEKDCDCVVDMARAAIAKAEGAA